MMLLYVWCRCSIFWAARELSSAGLACWFVCVCHTSRSWLRRRAARRHSRMRRKRDYVGAVLLLWRLCTAYARMLQGLEDMTACAHVSVLMAWVIEHACGPSTLTGVGSPEDSCDLAAISTVFGRVTPMTSVFSEAGMYRSVVVEDYTLQI
jgi:hypothetical protein